jgi:hypothetical protein
MKKLSIVLLAFLFIGVTNINAQTETDVTAEISEVEQLKANCPDWGTDKCPYTINEDGKLICKKSGKECSAEDLKKCCKSKSKCSKSKSKCSKSGKKGAFNYGNSNNYSGEKSSCSKKSRKHCKKGKSKKSYCSKKEAKKCGDDCTKPCCAPVPEEVTPTQK